MTEVLATTETGRRPPYKIIVDRKPHDWPEPVITGAQIKRLAGVDQATYDAWRDVPGPEDLLIADDRKSRSHASAGQSVSSPARRRRRRAKER